MTLFDPATSPHVCRKASQRVQSLGSPSLTSGLRLHFMTIRLNRMCVWRGARPALLSAALSKPWPVLIIYCVYMLAIPVKNAMMTDM